MGMVTTWPGDWITLNEHVNRWCHGISRLTLNQSMGSKLTAAWSVTSQSVSQAHLAICRSYQGLSLFFASKWLFNDTQPWSQCLGCWNQNVWGSREVIGQGVVRVSQCMGSYRGCIGSWGVVSGSRLEDCPQALAWSPRWPINCRQWLRQSASCDLGPTTCQIIWQTVTLWWANTSPRPTSNRANLWPGGDKNFPSQLTLLYPMNSAFVPLDCKNLSRDIDWKCSPSSNLKHKEVDLVAENPPIVSNSGPISSYWEPFWQRLLLLVTEWILSIVNLFDVVQYRGHGRHPRDPNQIHPTDGHSVQALHPGDKYRRNTLATKYRCSQSPKIGCPWAAWIILSRAVTTVVERSFEYRSNDICHDRPWWIMSDIWSCNHRAIIEVNTANI